MESKHRKLQGIVTSDKMVKTVVVSVTHTRTHAKYQKAFKVTSKFKAHDEGEVCNIGDLATIIEGRPMSKTKRWTIVECSPRKLSVNNSAEPIVIEKNN